MHKQFQFIIKIWRWWPWCKRRKGGRRDWEIVWWSFLWSQQSRHSKCMCISAWCCILCSICPHTYLYLCGKDATGIAHVACAIFSFRTSTPAPQLTRLLVTNVSLVYSYIVNSTYYKDIILLLWTSKKVGNHMNVLNKVQLFHLPRNYYYYYYSTIIIILLYELYRVCLLNRRTCPDLTSLSFTIL